MFTRLLQLCLLFFIPVFMHAQDLSGTWEGNAGGAYVKIVLARAGDHFVGYAYDREMGGFCKTNFVVTYDSSSNTYTGTCKGFIEKTFGHTQSIYNLTYSVSGAEFLKGTIRAKTGFMQVLSFGMAERVTLRKTSEQPDDTTAFMVKELATATPGAPVISPVPAEKNNPPATDIKDSTLTPAPPVVVVPAAPPAPSEILANAGTTRKTDTVQTIRTGERSIRFRLYDNGIEDQDSILIMVNGKILDGIRPVARTPYEFELNLGPDETVQYVTLIAKNEGTIPPNTATVEIIAGKNRYTVNATSNLSRNAMIVVRYAP